jgi:hypothetical protein
MTSGGELLVLYSVGVCIVQCCVSFLWLCPCELKARRDTVSLGFWQPHLDL